MSSVKGSTGLGFSEKLTGPSEYQDNQGDEKSPPRWGKIKKKPQQTISSEDSDEGEVRTKLTKKVDKVDGKDEKIKGRKPEAVKSDSNAPGWWEDQSDPSPTFGIEKLELEKKEKKTQKTKKLKVEFGSIQQPVQFNVGSNFGKDSQPTPSPQFGFGFGVESFPDQANKSDFPPTPSDSKKSVESQPSQPPSIWGNLPTNPTVPAGSGFNGFGPFGGETQKQTPLHQFVGPNVTFGSLPTDSTHPTSDVKPQFGDFKSPSFDPSKSTPLSDSKGSDKWSTFGQLLQSGTTKSNGPSFGVNSPLVSFPSSTFGQVTTNSFGEQQPIFKSSSSDQKPNLSLHGANFKGSKQPKFEYEQKKDSLDKNSVTWTPAFDNTLQICLQSFGPKNLDRISECFLDKDGEEIFSKSEIRERIGFMTGKPSQFQFQSNQIHIDHSSGSSSQILNDDESGEILRYNKVLSRKTCDVCFLVTEKSQSRQIWIHKNIFSLRSPYLKRIFYEKNVKECPLDFPIRVVTLFCDIVYDPANLIAKRRIFSSSWKNIHALIKMYEFLEMDQQEITKLFDVLPRVVNEGSMVDMFNFIHSRGDVDLLTKTKSACIDCFSELNNPPVLEFEIDTLFALRRERKDIFTDEILFRYARGMKKENTLKFIKNCIDLEKTQSNLKWFGPFLEFFESNIDSMSEKQLNDLLTSLIKRNPIL